MSHHPSPWRTSSYSGSGNECVEVRSATEHTDVRDSKNPSGATLNFPATTWHNFLPAQRRPGQFMHKLPMGIPADLGDHHVPRLQLVAHVQLQRP